MKSEERRLARAIQSAGRWIVQSGIQIRDPRLPTWGAFNAWYDMDSKRHRYVYPEITGYGILTLLYLDDRRHDLRLLELARIAGDWAIQRAIHPCGGVRPRDFYEQSERDALFLADREVIVTFDSGIMIFALADLYEKTKSSSYLNASRQVADFVVDCAQKKDGLLYACYDPQKLHWLDDPAKWSTQSGPYHAKLSMGLLRLHQLTNETKYRLATERLCEACLKLQLPNGRFVTYRREKATHLHPHLYAAEGMLYAGKALGDERLTRSASKAAQWALDQQVADGGIPCVVGFGRSGAVNQNQRSDTLAQALRLALLCHARGELPARSLKKLPALMRRLLSFQNTRGPQAGGFLYGQEMNGVQRNHLNFWATAFALQALVLYDEVIQRRRPPAPLRFV